MSQTPIPMQVQALSIPLSRVFMQVPITVRIPIKVLRVYIFFTPTPDVHVDLKITRVVHD